MSSLILLSLSLLSSWSLQLVWYRLKFPRNRGIISFSFSNMLLSQGAIIYTQTEYFRSNSVAYTCVYFIIKSSTSDIAFLALWLVHSISVISSYTVWPNWKLIGLNFQMSKRSECNENLIKQLFHSHLLDMRLVIANLALRASLAIYNLIFDVRSRNNC